MPEGVGYGPQNTASIGLDIHVIGNHAYALSGMFGASTAEQTMLDFTSGNYYLVGRLTFTGFVRPEAPQSGSISAALLSFNGIPIAILKNDGANETQPTTSYSEIIIPPYTNVKVTVESSDDDADNDGSVLITGKIFK
jgi:hypothetical protein